MRYTYGLYDEYDRVSGTTSMARTTGFPCAIMARLVATGAFTEPGVFPLEHIAPCEGLFERMLKELGARNVNVTERIEQLDPNRAR